jgi:hypothetical protein
MATWLYETCDVMWINVLLLFLKKDFGHTTMGYVNLKKLLKKFITSFKIIMQKSLMIFNLK